MTFRQYIIPLKGKTMITRIKKSLTAVPASIIEAASYLVSLGEKQRQINRIKRDASERVKAINAEAEGRISAIKKERDVFFTALYAFAVSKKEELTQRNRSVATASGRFGWRWTPPSVLLAKGKSEEEIITLLESSDMEKYVRVLKEIDREALLRDRPSVPGVEYTQREEFFAKPKMKKEEGRAEELVKSTEAVDL